MDMRTLAYQMTQYRMKFVTLAHIFISAGLFQSKRPLNNYKAVSPAIFIVKHVAYIYGVDPHFA